MCRMCYNISCDNICAIRILITGLILSLCMTMEFAYSHDQSTKDYTPMQCYFKTIGQQGYKLCTPDQHECIYRYTKQQLLDLRLKATHNVPSLPAHVRATVKALHLCRRGERAGLHIKRLNWTHTGQQGVNVSNLKRLKSTHHVHHNANRLQLCTVNTRSLRKNLSGRDY